MADTKNADTEDGLSSFETEESAFMSGLQPYPNADEERDLWRRYSKLRRIDEVVCSATGVDEPQEARYVFFSIVTSIGQSTCLVQILRRLSGLDKLGDRILEDTDNSLRTMIELYRLIQDSKAKLGKEGESDRDNPRLQDLFGFVFVEMINNIAFGRGNPNLVTAVSRVTNRDELDVRASIYRLAIDRDLLPKDIMELTEPNAPLDRLPQLMRDIQPQQSINEVLKPYREFVASCRQVSRLCSHRSKMSRFIATVICVMLISALLPLSDSVAASTISMKPEPNDVAYQSDVSPYDGTYTGTFKYAYQEWEPNPLYPGSSNEQFVLSEKDYITLTLEVTFETTLLSGKGVIPDAWYLQISHIKVNDPAFLTTMFGITPEYGSYMVVLPRNYIGNPADLEKIARISIRFPPNDSWLDIYGKDFSVVGLNVSEIKGSSWSARVKDSPGHPLSDEHLPGHPDWDRYVVTFGEWSLKKVPGDLSAEQAGEAKVAYKSGNVYVWNELAGEWQNTDLDILKSNTKIKTGENGRVILEYGDDYEFTVAPNTTVDLADLNETIDVLLGRVFFWMKTNIGQKPQVRTPTAIAAHRGTEFTVDVAVDGTTTVIVFEGAVSITDLTSNKGIMLAPSQSATIPKTPTGLTQEQMLGRVKYVPPDSVDRWWEKSPAPTGEQTAAQGAVRQDGSLIVGKFEIIRQGSGFTPAGFIFAFTAIAAIFFLAVGQVFSYRLRRLSKRKSFS